jgi:hypothetical protein
MALGGRLVWDDAALRRLTSEPGVVHDLEEKGQRVAAAARRLAPVRTGALRSSIAVSTTVDAQGAVVEVSESVPYGLYVKPFLGPALHSIKEI